MMMMESGLNSKLNHRVIVMDKYKFYRRTLYRVINMYEYLSVCIEKLSQCRQDVIERE